MSLTLASRMSDPDGNTADFGR